MVQAVAVNPWVEILDKSHKCGRLRGSPASISLLIQFGDMRSPHLGAEKLPLLMRAESENQIVNVEYEEEQKKSHRDGESLL